jgi:flagella basal body P-ring formation protein FlgA
MSGVLLVCATGWWFLWPRGLAKRNVCVAIANLPAYDQITAADVRKTEVPSDDVPSQATTDPSDLVGRYTLAAVQRDRPFDLAGLGPKLPVGALAQRLIVGLPASILDIASGV